MKKQKRLTLSDVLKDFSPEQQSAFKYLSQEMRGCGLARLKESLPVIVGEKGRVSSQLVIHVTLKEYEKAKLRPVYKLPLNVRGDALAMKRFARAAVGDALEALTKLTAAQKAA